MKFSLNTVPTYSEPIHFCGSVWAEHNPVPAGFRGPVVRFRTMREAARYEGQCRQIVCAATGIASDHGIFAKRAAKGYHVAR